MSAFRLTMHSDEYGTEFFDYETRAEAEAGRARIEAKAVDGVERFFSITEEKDE